VGERLRMVGQGMSAVLRAKLPRGMIAAIEVDASPPVGAIVQHTREVLSATSPPWLVNHGYRTYAWAMAIASRDGLRPDRELMYCAALFHDLGVVEPYLAKAGECFALTGAKGAMIELRKAGMDEARARVVAEAIALHLNLVVELAKWGPEAHLLRAGTALDVAGQDYERIHEGFRNATLQEFPRLMFKQEVAAMIQGQADQSPKTRSGFLCHTLQLPKRARAAPFKS
jgi:hypothetical protein